MGELRGPIVTRSRLETSPEEAWAHATSFEGVNYELGPVLRMTAPREVREAGLEGVVIGKRLCRSWVLLFGVLPVDYDDITLERLDPGRGFLERSPMLSQREWEHERTIEPADGGGCVVTDSIRWAPRLPAPERLTRRVVTAAFAHRHKRLRRRFGGEPS
ncbi:MAG: hypothetical protein WD649_00090 [Thermoleophilaceae bacterium]